MFTKGGLVLFAYQPATLSGDPVAALINTCLLEERAGDEAFGYTAPDGVSYALKWAFHNESSLVFVAVYQRALALSYVDSLLATVKKVFTQQHYQPQVRSSPYLLALLCCFCQLTPPTRLFLPPPSDATTTPFRRSSPSCWRPRRAGRRRRSGRGAAAARREVGASRQPATPRRW